MKKLINYALVFIVSVIFFASCENVPQPYDMNFDPNSTSEQKEEITPKGTGTKEDPFNIAAARNYVEKNKNLDKEVYVKGKIVMVKDVNLDFGNASYFISDNGTEVNRFYIYRGKALGNKKFTSDKDIKIGDEVIVCGKLTKFNNLPQMGQGNYIYSLNGKTATETPEQGKTEVKPTGEGTEKSPYNVAKAQEVIKTTKELPTKPVYVTGVISKIKSMELGKYGSAEYYISDNGKEAGQLYVFHGKYLNGKKFTSENQIKVGDKVIVKGKLDNFKGNSPQIAFGYLVSINNQSSKVILSATFDKDMAGFKIENINLPSELSDIWYHDTKYHNMKATATKKVAEKKYVKYAAQSRLVSPEFSLKGINNAVLSFEHCGKYFGNIKEECKVMISTDGTTWTELTVSKYPNPDFKYVTSTCDLSKYAGKDKVYISFLYTSTTKAAPTWEIKNVEVK